MQRAYEDAAQQRLNRLRHELAETPPAAASRPKPKRAPSWDQLLGAGGHGIDGAVVDSPVAGVPAESVHSGPDRPAGADVAVAEPADQAADAVVAEPAEQAADAPAAGGTGRDNAGADAAAVTQPAAHPLAQPATATEVHQALILEISQDQFNSAEPLPRSSTSRDTSAEAATRPLPAHGG